MNTCEAQDLIDIGIVQGMILRFHSSLKNDDPLFNSIKDGRFGIFSDEGVGSASILLVLSQECSLSSRDYVELVQGKKEKKFDPQRNNHLLDAQDYGKLVIKIDDDYFGFKEPLITKLPQSILMKAIQEEKVSIGERIAPHVKRRLLDWRVLEYVREPFPDKFNRALLEFRKGKGQWFFDYLADNQEGIDSLRVYITPEDNESAEEYQIVVAALMTDGASEELQTETSANIERMLTELYEDYQFISPLQIIDVQDELTLPGPVSLAFTQPYDEFTFSAAYHMREFNLQFLCY